MPDWTQPAREEVRRYFTRVRASLAESGADPDEVIGDLDRHIDEEIAAASLAVVTEEDARRILARIGPPDSQPRAEPQRPTLVENALQALGNKLVSDRAKDNGFALRGRVADLELAGPEAVVVWIHGPQPVLLDTAEELRQRLERRGGHPSLCEIQTQAGPNRVAEKLDGLQSVMAAPRLGKLSDDLSPWVTEPTSTPRSAWSAGNIPSKQKRGRRRTMKEARLGSLMSQVRPPGSAPAIDVIPRTCTCVCSEKPFKSSSVNKPIERMIANCMTAVDL